MSLRLEGRVEGPWVEVLRTAWVETKERAGDQRIVVDLSAVSFADSEGRTLLLKMREQGAGLMRASGFMRQILGQDGSKLDGHHSDEKGE
ncbi:MAG: hypothetical protein ABR953_12920 [Candidatus Acidiferrales bacterium]|jgi:ABC-type transporter Mla MlaB component